MFTKLNVISNYLSMVNISGLGFDWLWCNFSDGFDQFRKFDKGSCCSKTSLLLFHLNNIKRGPVGTLEK